MKNFYLTFIFLSFFTSVLFAQTPAFPGAEGGGMYTTGGRGGTVYFVTSLDDTNTGNTTTREGTFRWCLGRSGAKTIVFKVGGIIRLNSRLTIPANTTIAGQTAPGDGICIADNCVVVNGDNVIVRFMRFRMGDLNKVQDDAFWGREKKNLIIDHCSMSWSIDECSSFYSNENFTMQWCIVAEALNKSFHEKDDHGYGGIWGGKNATFHHNLLAHNNSRNPRFNGWKRAGLSYSNPLGEERVDYRNNVVYNWGGNSTYGGEALGKYNMVANYYKYGPGTSSGVLYRLNQIDKDASTDAIYAPYHGQYYIVDNYVYGSPTTTNNNWYSSGSQGIKYASGIDPAKCKASEPFKCENISQHTAEKAFEMVLEYAGASFVRDAVDARITNEAKTGTITYLGSKTGKKGIIDSQTDVGGWPEYKSGTTPVDSDSDGIPDGWLDTNYPGHTANEKNNEGYTYLELYLNSLVQSIVDGQLEGATKDNDDDDDDDTEDKVLFCGNIPTDGIVSQELLNLITNGTVSIASNRSDGCTENGYTWRPSTDIIFTLPAKSSFNANLTANGTRKVYVTINGDESNKDLYSLSSTSCSPVTYPFNSNTENTIRIQSYGSDGLTPSQISMTELCIKEKISTDIHSAQYNKQVKTFVSNNHLYFDAQKIEIYSINGQKILTAENVGSVSISHLNKGVYVARLFSSTGEITCEKVVKK